MRKSPGFGPVSEDKAVFGHDVKRMGQEVWTAYDQKFRYLELLQLSQKLAPQKPTVDVKSVQWLKIMEPEQAKAWVDKSRVIMNQDQKLRLEFVEDVLDSLDPYLTSYFLSEYMIMYLRFGENKPTDPPAYACNWHCDVGPPKHAKLLLYLNDSDDSGSNTLFLERESTDAFDSIGYLFCSLNHRLSDLSELAKEYNLPYNISSKHIAAGEGVFFEPSKIMHRGIWATKEPRYMVQMLFLPSPVPWGKVYEKYGMPTTSNTWRKEFIDDFRRINDDT